MDINSLLNSMDKSKILNSIKNITSTPQGQELMKKLKDVDKNELMNHLGSIKDGDFSKEELVKQLTSDPNLVKKLNEFLEKKG